MKAFMLSVAALLLIIAIAHFGLKPLWETSSEEAYSMQNVRLN